MIERSVSKALEKGFANEKLRPLTLAQMTYRLFTDSMNLRLERWYRLHWELCYPSGNDEILDLL